MAGRQLPHTEKRGCKTRRTAGAEAANAARRRRLIRAAASVASTGRRQYAMLSLLGLQAPPAAVTPSPASPGPARRLWDSISSAGRRSALVARRDSSAASGLSTADSPPILPLAAAAAAASPTSTAPLPSLPMSPTAAEQLILALPRLQTEAEDGAAAAAAQPAASGRPSQPAAAAANRSRATPISPVSKLHCPSEPSSPVEQRAASEAGPDSPLPGGFPVPELDRVVSAVGGGGPQLKSSGEQRLRTVSPTSSSAAVAAAHREALEKRDRRSTTLSYATRSKQLVPARVESSLMLQPEAVRSPELQPRVREQRAVSKAASAGAQQERSGLDFGLDLDGNVEDEHSEEGKGGNSDTEQDSEKQSRVFSHFSAHLHLFSYVLLLAGLRQSTSSFYRNWLRVVTYGCTAMCFSNLFLRTAAYRNPLFDSTLVVLHVLVCASYEWWLRFCKSRDWRLLMSIVTKVSSQHFARHIRLLGIFALVMVTGATVTIVLGWELPIFAALALEHSQGIAGQGGAVGDYVFLILHGAFMIIIIGPWAAVCMASVCLFKLLVLAHQSDIEHHFLFITHTLRQAMDSLATEQERDRDTAGMSMSQSRRQPLSSPTAGGGSSARRDVVADSFRQVVKHHQAVRARLRATCRYFQYLVMAYMLTSLLLVFSAALDFNHYASGFPFRSDVWQNSLDLSLFPHLVQDLFYIGVGLLGFYGSGLVTSSLTSSFDRFVRRINDLPIAFPNSSLGFMTISPATLAGLVSYYRNSRTAYTLFDIPVTFSLFAAFAFTTTCILFITLLILNPT